MRTSPPPVPGRLLLLAAVVASLPPAARSYVAGGGGSLPSRLADVTCDLTMTVGRAPDAATPPERAASWGRLELPLTLQFSADDPLEEASFSVEPLTEPSFASRHGWRETVAVRAGRGSFASTGPGSEKHAVRFFLDFPDGAAKDDATLPAERIYFMTACWDDGEGALARARRSKEDVVRSLQRVNAELRELDRRADPFDGDFLRRFHRRRSLAGRRRQLAAEVAGLEEAFPPGRRLAAAPNAVAFLREGAVAVRRERKGREEFRRLGTFRFKKFAAAP